jgi:hypothetical protein
MAAERYPVGTRIVMVESHDPDGTVPVGYEGRVNEITPEGELLVHWTFTGRISRVNITRDHIDDL